MKIIQDLPTNTSFFFHSMTDPWLHDACVVRILLFRSPTSTNIGENGGSEFRVNLVKIRCWDLSSGTVVHCLRIGKTLLVRTSDVRTIHHLPTSGLEFPQYWLMAEFSIQGLL